MPRNPDPRPDYFTYIKFDWRGIPRYVGKGRNGSDRDISHEKKTDLTNWRKNEFIEQTWIMLGEVPTVRMLENVSEAEAFEGEIALIAALGRIDKGTGTLVNLTDGGDGTSGYVYPEYLRNMRSIQFKRLRALEGREKLSERGRRNMLSKGRDYLSQRTKDQMAKISPEERSERSRRGNAKLTQEQRTARAVLRESRISAEKRSERALKAAQRRSPEERSLTAKKRQAAKTKEEKIRAGVIGAVTRKARGKANPRRGVYKNCLSCEKEFYVKRSWAETAKYCSHGCYASTLNDRPRDSNGQYKPT